MKSLAFVLFSLWGTCLARGRWKAFDCGADDDIIQKAFSDAVIIAETAADVLEHNYDSDPVVKSITEYVLGAGDSLSAKVDRAKAYLNGIKEYEKQPSPFLGRPGGDNEDLLIHCKNPYELKTARNGQERLYHRDLNVPVNEEERKVIDVCFDASVQPGAGQNLVMAKTSSSDRPDPVKLSAELQRWQDAGSPMPPGPDIASYLVPQPTYLNTLDLCTWYLAFVRDGGRGFARFMKEDNGGATVISNDVVDRIRDPTFDLGTVGATRTINVLTESLAGTLLHELSHTNLGGQALDMPPGNCYGWDCIKGLQNPENADSINHLGIAMYLWKNGYRVAEDGSIHTL